jgi:hypothetical protein
MNEWCVAFRWIHVLGITWISHLFFNFVNAGGRAYGRLEEKSGPRK